MQSITHRAFAPTPLCRGSIRVQWTGGADCKRRTRTATPHRSSRSAALVTRAAAVLPPQQTQKPQEAVKGKELAQVQGGTASASGENRPNETAANAFDGSNYTKWLDFTGRGGAETWLQYSLDASATPVGVVSYELISANDFPSRDPRDWQLLGAADEGGEWKQLHTASNIEFSGRKQTLTFDVASVVPCRRWKLRITSLRDNRNADTNSVQLEQLVLLAPVAPSPPPKQDPVTAAPNGKPGTNGLANATKSLADKVPTPQLSQTAPASSSWLWYLPVWLGVLWAVVRSSS